MKQKSAKIMSEILPNTRINIYNPLTVTPNDFQVKVEVWQLTSCVTLGYVLGHEVVQTWANRVETFAVASGPLGGTLNQISTCLDQSSHIRGHPPCDTPFTGGVHAQQLVEKNRNGSAYGTSASMARGHANMRVINFCRK
jgi:hypothetical protein